MCAAVLLVILYSNDTRREYELKNTVDMLSTQVEELKGEQVAYSFREKEYDRALKIFQRELTEIKSQLNESEKENAEDTVTIEKNELTVSDGEWKIGQELDVPIIPSEVKFFTDYREYNIYGTPHNRLQQVAYTDKDGCRRYGNDYLVALGSYYSVDIGDRFEITLDTGNVFTIMLADGKNDKDLDPLRMYDPCETYGGLQRANVLEFIIDSDILSSEVFQYGSLDKIPELQGSITKIVYLGRDESGDWTTYV